MRMPKTSELELDDARRILLKAKLGRLLHWSPPEISNTVGPFTPSVFTEFDERRLSLIREVTERLYAFSDAEIGLIAEGQGDDAEDLRDQWKVYRRSELDRLEQGEPPWYAGGFGHPDHQANFEYWCKMPRFNVEETLCLSIGIEPREFDRKQLLKLKEVARTKKVWPAIRFLIDRHQQLTRAFDPNFYGWSVRPRELLAWVERVEFEVHPEFFRLLDRYHRTKGSSSQRDGGSVSIDKREVESMAKLLTAIAVRELGYQPNALRSPIPKEIADIAAEVGISVSEDTVRKYLKIGSRFLPKTPEDE